MDTFVEVRLKIVNENRICYNINGKNGQKHNTTGQLTKYVPIAPEKVCLSLILVLARISLVIVIP